MATLTGDIGIVFSGVSMVMNAKKSGLANIFMAVIGIA